MGNLNFINFGFWGQGFVLCDKTELNINIESINHQRLTTRILRRGVFELGKKTIRDIDVQGKKVLVRVDFNVPLDKNGEVADDNRIKATLPTINYLREQGAKVILISHLGRPKGKVDEKYSLNPVAARLSELLGLEVPKMEDCVGAEVLQATEKLEAGQVLLLENVRFHPEEEKDDPDFAAKLAKLADIYVNDAFGAAHRSHASTEGVARILPGVAGFLMEKELEMLGKIVNNPERPLVAILGGAKISDKIEVISNLLGKVDTLIIGGGMANTFLKAKGYELGKSLLEPEKIELAYNLIQKAQETQTELILPDDVVVALNADPDSDIKQVPVEAIPPEWMALDIGSKTIDHFIQVFQTAKTVIWNGPMGVFEMEPFSKGTLKILEALSKIQAITVVGGGDSAAAVKKSGLADKFTHISTGGGASLEFLEGKILPGVAVLQDK